MNNTGINKIDIQLDTGRVCQELAEKPKTDAVLEKVQYKQFQKEIWSNPKWHNLEAEWTANLRNSPEQCLTEITRTEEQEKLKKMSEWKATGQDVVHVFWVMDLTALHDRISSQLQDLINHPEGIPK